MGLITRWLGIDRLERDMVAERAQVFDLVRDILRTSAAQADAAARMADSLDRLTRLTVTEGAPEGRPGCNDEIEVALWEQTHES